MLNRQSCWWAVVVALALAGCGVVDDLVSSNDLAVRRFVADPPEVGSGAAVTLSWDVEGAESVEIDNGVGGVKERGNHEVRPSVSTRYILVARKGSEQVTALVNVAVVSPTPSPTPTIAPSPSPTPTIAPTPSPTPTPVPKPSPSPSPSEAQDPPVKCAPSIRFSGTCGVGLTYLQALGETRCVSLPEAGLSLSCPGAFGATRGVSLLLEARGFKGRSLTWRPAASSGNYVLSPGGTLSGDGRTRVELQDVLLGDQTVLEVLDGGAPVAQVTVRSN